MVIRSAAHYRCYFVLCSGHTQRSVSQMFLCNAIWPNIVQLSYSSCTLQMIWCNAIWPNIAQFSYSDYSSSAAFVLVQFNQIFCSGHTRGLKGRIADVLMRCTTRLKKEKKKSHPILCWWTRKKKSFENFSVKVILKILKFSLILHQSQICTSNGLRTRACQSYLLTDEV